MILPGDPDVSLYRAVDGGRLRLPDRPSPTGYRAHRRYRRREAEHPETRAPTRSGQAASTSLSQSQSPQRIAATAACACRSLCTVDTCCSEITLPRAIVTRVPTPSPPATPQTSSQRSGRLTTSGGTKPGASSSTIGSPAISSWTTKRWNWPPTVATSSLRSLRPPIRPPSLLWPSLAAGLVASPDCYNRVNRPAPRSTHEADARTDVLAAAWLSSRRCLNCR